MSTQSNSGLRAGSWKRVALDTVALGLLFACVGLVVNLLRDDGLPLVADKPYDILVPCPEPLGEVSPVDPSALDESGILVIDARSPEEYARWHHPEARNVQWDELDPIPKETVAELIRLGARKVVVYGDALDPDSGRSLARELAGQGATNVFYIEGGAPRLKGPTGGAP